MCKKITPRYKITLIQLADLIARSRRWHDRIAPISTTALSIYLEEIQFRNIGDEILLLFVLLHFKGGRQMKIPEALLKKVEEHGWVHHGRTTYWGVVEAMRVADGMHFPGEFADAFVAAEDRHLRSRPLNIEYHGLAALRPEWAGKIGRLVS